MACKFNVRRGSKVSVNEGMTAEDRQILCPKGDGKSLGEGGTISRGPNRFQKRAGGYDTEALFGIPAVRNHGEYCEK